MLPAALSGIVAAMILAVSRAIGETMIVALAAGTNGIMNFSPLDGGLTMTGAMAQLAIGSHQVALYQQVVSPRFEASDWHAWMGIGYRYWW